MSICCKKLVVHSLLMLMLIAPQLLRAEGIVISFIDKSSSAFPKNPPYTCSVQGVNAALTRLGVTDIQPLWRGSNAGLTNIYLLVAPIGVSEQQLEAELPYLNNIPAVDYAELDGELEVAGDPFVVEPQDYWYWHSYPWNDHTSCYSDTTHHRQWNIARSHFDRAWAISTGDSNVVVAIIDTGMDMEHPELVNRICWNASELNGLAGADDDSNGCIDDFYGWDFYSRDNNPDHVGAGYNDHGTAMAGIIAAATDNEAGFSGFRGIAGLTWKPKVLPLKCGHYGGISYSAVVNALNYVMDYQERHPEKRFAAVNMSFAGGFYQGISDALVKLRESGIIAIAGAGNNDGSVLFPANDDNCLAMAWIDSLGIKATGNDGSAYGPEVALCGFGERGGYGNWAPPSPYHAIQVQRLAYEESWWQFNLCGSSFPHQIWVTPMLTSGATAQGSALAALLVSAHPNLSRDQIVALMKRGAVDVDNVNPNYAGMLGDGYIDAYRSLTLWGHVERDTLLSGDVYVAGDVTIDVGVTVTISEGTTIHFAPDDILEVGGKPALIVEGFLDVLGQEQTPVVFSGWSVDRGFDNWEGIYVAPGGSMSLKNAFVRNAETGVYASGATEIIGSQVDSCGVGIYIDSENCVLGPGAHVTHSQTNGVSIVECTAIVYSMNVDSSGLHGLLVSGGDIVLNGAVAIDHSQGHGLKVENATVALVPVAPAALTIDHSGNAGIYADNSTVSSAGVTILRSATGIASANGSYVSFENGEVRSAVVGLTADFTSELAAQGNSISRCSSFYAANGNANRTMNVHLNCWDASESPSSGKFVGLGPIEWLPADCQ